MAKPIRIVRGGSMVVAPNSSVAVPTDELGLDMTTIIEIRFFTLVARSSAVGQSSESIDFGTPPRQAPGILVWCAMSSEPLEGIAATLFARGVSDADVWRGLEDGMSFGQPEDGEEGEDSAVDGAGTLLRPWLRRRVVAGRVFVEGEA